MKKLSIVVPVFNSADMVSLFSEKIQSIEKELAEKQVGIELIFIDDGSSDDSWEEMKKLKSQRESAKVIKLTRNFGAVRASKAGMQYVTGDCFIAMAVDLQDPPELLPQMIEKWQGGSKYVICVRTTREDPISSKIFSFIYYRLVRLLVVKDFPSTGFDMMLMDRQLLPHVQHCGKNIHRSLYAHWLGYKPEIIRYKRPKREHGKSGWSFAKKFKLVIDSLLGFTIFPIRLITFIGIIVAIFGFIYGSITFIGKLMGNIPTEGYTTIIVLLTFLLGLIIIMLGIIGEYLWRIFDETNKSPEYVIDEVH